MEKPISLEVKDYLIRKLAVDLKTSESIISTVISSAYEEANKATKIHNEVEISGFGKMLLSQHKLQRRILNMTKGLERLRNTEGVEERANKLQLHIDYLKTKIKNG